MDKTRTGMPSLPTAGDSPPAEANAAKPAGPLERKRNRTSKITREMILQAALREFSEQGYDGATTAAIARRVGVTQPLIHYHFGTKDALWREAVNTVFLKLSAAIEATEQRVHDCDLRTILLELTYTYVDFLAHNPELSRLIVNEGVVASPRMSWLIEVHIGPLFRRCHEYLDLGKQEGFLRSFPNMYVMFAVLGASYHFFDLAPVVREIYGIDARSPEHVRAYADTMIEIFLRGMLDLGPERD